MAKGSLDHQRTWHHRPYLIYTVPRVDGDRWEIWDGRRYSHPGEDKEGYPLCNLEDAWTGRRVADEAILFGFQTRHELIAEIDRYYE